MADPIAPAEAEAAEAEAAEAEAAAAEAEIAEAEREAAEAEAEIAEAEREAAEAEAELAEAEAEAFEAAKTAEAEIAEAKTEAAEAAKAADALNALSGIYSSTELQHMLRSSKLTYFRHVYLGGHVWCIFEVRVPHGWWALVQSKEQWIQFLEEQDCRPAAKNFKNLMSGSKPLPYPLAMKVKALQLPYYRIGSHGWPRAINFDEVFSIAGSRKGKEEGDDAWLG
ncbi:unnamed protein product [Cladocopium goreaui]|uniref:Uncharacterized protein n=1 Tax=Cladocopium goreaui TaxID=2562237 RepID=A0A9P1GEN1_9DINO|nr:unnamed protein product [Cladocopium goreaui]